MGEGEGVVVAQVEGGDGGVEEISQQGVGEGWLWLVDLLCVHLHGGIVADRLGGTRGKWWSAGILRTGVVGRSDISWFILLGARLRPSSAKEVLGWLLKVGIRPPLPFGVKEGTEERGISVEWGDECEEI